MTKQKMLNKLRETRKLLNDIMNDDEFEISNETYDCIFDMIAESSYKIGKSMKVIMRDNKEEK